MSLSSESLTNIHQVLSTQVDQFKTAREASVTQLRHIADRIERTNYYGEAGKIAANSVSVIGGLTTVGALVTAGCLAAVTGPMVAPVVAAACAVSSVAKVAGTGSTCVMNVKNRHRKQDVDQALQHDRQLMEDLAKELQQLPVYACGLPEEAMESAKLLTKVYELNALGITCSPEEINKNAEIIEHVMEDDCTGFAEKSLAEVHTHLQEKLKEVDLRYLNRCVDKEKVLEKVAELGTEVTEEIALHPVVDQAIGVVGELAVEELLPLSVFLLPKLVQNVANDSKKFCAQDYKKAADDLRDTALKLEEDGRKVVKEQMKLVRSTEVLIARKNSSRVCGTGAMLVAKVAAVGCFLWFMPWQICVGVSVAFACLCCFARSS